MLEIATIVYYTDNRINKRLQRQARRHLDTHGFPVVSVENEERSHLQMFRNILAGLEQVATRYVALAEHDCFYPTEHFQYIPESGIFCYNTNHLFLDYKRGLFSTPPGTRMALSGLICERDLLFDAVTERVKFLESGGEIQRGIRGACEFGVIDQYQAKEFRTSIPYLDVRHGDNFSGARKGENQTSRNEHWGTLVELMAPPGKWYQEATIKGVPMPQRRKTDLSEIRWNTFIAPLIQRKGGTVTDLGCNAGFYSRKFVDLGFTVTGVEREPEFLEHAKFWEEMEPKGIRIVGQDITKYEPACSHIVLLANVHYWLTPAELEKLELKLRGTALDVILIGRHRPRKEHKSPCTLEYLKSLFREWELVQTIQPESKHFSVLFRNRELFEKPVDEIMLYPKECKDKLIPAYLKLLDGDEQDYRVYQGMRGARNVDALIKRHTDLVGSMREFGIKEPLTIGRVENGEYLPNFLADGDHRLIVAKKLGMKSLICKTGEKK